ncbi:MAG: hypothetical protein BGO77_05905 [Caedibacter sp. 37-49]|nr:MAG: hypothetical protein BGO77_05905 [Caedibacter sp. 37-49]
MINIKYAVYSTFILLFLSFDIKASSLWEELPQDIITLTASFVRIKDGINAQLVSKRWHKVWNNDYIWYEYVQRFPGHERVVKEVNENDCSISPYYKMVFKELLTLKLIILEKLNDGPVSYTSDISGDGKTLVGYTLNANLQSKFIPFIWTQEEGINFINAAHDKQTSYTASISQDGKIVIGYESDGRTSNSYKWTQQEGKTLLKKINIKDKNYAYTISANGKVIGGSIHLEGSSEIGTACLWTEQGEIKLTKLPANLYKSNIVGISADGRIILGNAHEKDKPEYSRSFLWTENEGTILLEGLTQGCSTYACGISSNGLTVVGYAYDNIADAYRAFTWNKKDGIKSLGSLRDKHHSYATAVNQDGRVIVGYVKDRHRASLKEAFIWTESTEMLSIETILGQKIPKDTLLTVATSISEDGTILIGDAHKGAIWYAYIPRLDILKQEGIPLFK